MTVVHHHDGGVVERWVSVTPGGLVLVRSEASGRYLATVGLGRSSETMTPEAAKRRWPRLAARIDAALGVTPEFAV